MPKNFGGGFNANMMKQVQKMQQDMIRTQAELETRTYTAASGGGAVSVTVNGGHQITELMLDPDVVDRDDVEMLQDLITTAVNAALKEADETVAREMGKFRLPPSEEGGFPCLNACCDRDYYSPPLSEGDVATSDRGCLKMQHPVFNLFRLAHIPEVLAQVPAGAAGDIHLLAVFVAAIRALPNEIIIHRNLAIESAHMAVIAAGIELSVLPQGYVACWGFPRS
jgi:hypothetical protein